MNYNKTKVAEYLYPTPEVKGLLQKINEEIYRNIDASILINASNISKAQRKKNYRALYNIIEQYFNQNSNLYDKLLTAYNGDEVLIEKPLLKYHMLKKNDGDSPMLFNDNETITDIIFNLVFDYTQKQEDYENLNIFKDKKSLCYDGKPSLYDILNLQ